MFEQATLVSAPGGKRVWTTVLGFTTQLMLVSGAVLAPMVWPQVMPHAHLMAIFLPPVPHGPPLKAAAVPAAAQVRVIRELHSLLEPLRQPARIPTAIAIIDDAPIANEVIGVPYGDPRGSERGIPGALFNLAGSSPRIDPPPPVVAKPKPVTLAEEPKRFREGGRVQLGRLIRKVDPAYPSIAKAARASGVVQLEAVVGTDGRIREVRVTGGSALLSQAAVDAVRQWIYEPSRLNGDLIEIIANIVVTFRLN